MKFGDHIRIIKSSQLSFGTVVVYLETVAGIGGAHKIRCTDGNIVYLSNLDKFEVVING